MCSHPAIAYAAKTGNRRGDEEMNPELPTENQGEGGSMKMKAKGQIARGGAEGESTVDEPPSESQSEQYSLAMILGIWAAAALPMGALAWVVAPWLAGQLDGPAPLMRTLLALLTIGLIWQFALVMVLVYRERGSLRWSVLKDALWLRAPRSPKTGRVGGRLWLVLIPFVLLFAAE